VMYFVARGTTGATHVQHLHAVSIVDGSEMTGSPTQITATYSGSGTGSVNGVLTFDAQKQNQRQALTLLDGIVYVSFASHCDWGPYHGWIFGYDANTLQRQVVYNATPNGDAAGMWESGTGMAADASGNLYFTTSNGTFSLNTGGIDAGDTIIKMSPNGTIVDYFTPHDQANMATNNLELGSAGPMLLIDQPGAQFPHLLVTAGKEGTIYVINRDNMGHYNPNNDNAAVQVLVAVLPNGAQDTGNFSFPVYFNGFVYFAAVNDSLKAFQMINGLLSTGPTSNSSALYPNRGGAFSISANGVANGILWAVQDNTPSPAVLRAYNANNLATELYNSNQAGSRDSLDQAAKFNAPLVVNGKVYVGSAGRLTVYGLLP